ncbi:hypothetical protein pipiens_000615, partial [Culex pipiens pipiens]
SSNNNTRPSGWKLICCCEIKFADASRANIIGQAKQEPTPSKATFPELTTGGRAVDGLAFHPRLDGVHYERRLKSAVKLRQPSHPVGSNTSIRTTWEIIEERQLPEPNPDLLNDRRGFPTPLL